MKWLVGHEVVGWSVRFSCLEGCDLLSKRSLVNTSQPCHAMHSAMATPGTAVVGTGWYLDMVGTGYGVPGMGSTCIGSYWDPFMTSFGTSF